MGGDRVRSNVTEGDTSELGKMSYRPVSESHSALKMVRRSLSFQPSSIAALV